MSIKIKTSFGELLDKITILEIKQERIKNSSKLVNIEHELDQLTMAWNEVADRGVVEKERQALKQVNISLWDIEDNIREKELRQEFDPEFIELARSVYFTNDKRAELKKVVNTKLGSELLEEKSYQNYANAEGKQ